MQTKELARALRAFAGIADFERAQELHRLAAFLERGRSETVAARLKLAGSATHYPYRLKETLEAIELGLRSLGALKPSRTFVEVLRMLTGRPDASADTFFEEIAAAPRVPDSTARRFKSADANLATRIFSDLNEAANDAQLFHDRLEELAAMSPAGTATWTLVANQFVGNRRIYRDRKSAIRAIRRFSTATPLSPMTDRQNQSKSQ